MDEEKKTEPQGEPEENLNLPKEEDIQPLENPEHQPPREEPKLEKLEEEQKTVPKKFIFLVAGIVIIFIAIFAFFPLKNYFFPSTQVVTLDDLFEMNLGGELPEERGYLYNGYSFVYFDGLWYTQIQRDMKIFQIPLHFGPKELEEVEITGQLDDRFYEGENIYLVFDPLVTSDFVTTAIGEFAQSIAILFNKKTVPACDKNETEPCQKVDIINCTNTDQPVAYFLREPGPKIELKGNCIVIKGQDYDVVKAADRALYHWYGIMD